MTNTTNPIQISNFPETAFLLSSDKIILFKENESGNFTPSLTDLSSLTNTFISVNGLLTELQSKVNEFEKEYLEIERQLNNAYLTQEQISSTYSSTDNLNSQINKLQKTESFKNLLSNKSDSTYLEYQYNALRSKIQDMKKFLGSRDGWTNDETGESGKGYKILMIGQALQGGTGE